MALGNRYDVHRWQNLYPLQVCQLGRYGGGEHTKNNTSVIPDCDGMAGATCPCYGMNGCRSVCTSVCTCRILYFQTLHTDRWTSQTHSNFFAYTTTGAKLTHNTHGMIVWDCKIDKKSGFGLQYSTYDLQSATSFVSSYIFHVYACP